MKTTSYEISKKLEEAGFKAETNFYWYRYYDDGLRMRHIADADGKGDVEAYDLETILDALPDSITREYKSKEDGEVREFKETLKIDKYEICYRCNNIENADDANRYYQEYGYMQEFSIYNFSNTGSLADTAGKMWLMLKEKGIV